MSMVAISAILFAVSFVVLMVLVMKGMNLVPAALIAGLILAFGVNGGWFNGVYTIFAEGAGSYTTNLFIPFMVGGIFSAIMITTGSDVVIGNFLIQKFGVHFAIYSMGVFVAICGFAGIQSWPFLAVIMAFSLMKAADLPLNVAMVVMVGVNSAFSFMFPGSPTMGNLIASQALGTTIYAGSAIGVIMCLVQLVLVYIYVEFALVRKYRKAGIGYTPSHTEDSLRVEAVDLPDEQKPSFTIAIIPLVVVVAGCMIFQLGLGLGSTPATVIAQFIAIAVCVVLNESRIGVIKKLPATITNGCVQCAVPLLSVCAIVGYASLISNTAFYSVIMDKISSLNMNPYVMVVVGTALFAALSADSMGGLSMSVSTIGVKAVEAGAKAGLVHRLSMAAATTFDSMPHSSMLNVTMGFIGLTHKDVYKQIVVVQIGATSAATLVGMLICLAIG